MTPASQSKGADAPARPWGSNGPQVRFDEGVPAASREEILALLAGWDAELFPAEVEVSVLLGGANNRNFIVESGPRKYALRVANLQNERFAVDRASAIAAQAAAAVGDLAPAVRAQKLPEGNILSDFIEGSTLREAQHLADPDVLRLAGASFRRLHGLAAEIRSYSPFDDIRLWSRLAREDGSPLPDDLPEMIEVVDRIEQILLEAELPAVFCHNDTVPQNFILTDGKLQLVDWDYAGMGWACFELASFSATAELEPERQDILLAAYDPATDEGQRARVELLRLVAAVRETCWVLMAAPILKGTTTPEEADFYEDYYRRHLVMARDRLGDPGLGPLIEAAGRSSNRSW